jgi:hypothetical protein
MGAPEAATPETLGDDAVGESTLQPHSMKLIVTADISKKLITLFFIC